MRNKLSNRRNVETTTVTYFSVDGRESHFEASIGFDKNGKPKEIFLAGARTGSETDILLIDAAVSISVALQCGVSATAMSQSISRVSETLDGPPTRPASIIGAALELIASYEKREKTYEEG